MRSVTLSLWGEILGTLQTRSPDLMQSWFSQLQPVALEGGVLVVRARNSAQLRYLRARCQRCFAEAAQSATGRLISVVFEEVRLVQSANAAIVASDLVLEVPPLHPEYTFENFVTGPCNRLAHAAANAVSEAPGRTYNPLLIYSDAGLGKTHLAQAICHKLLNSAAPVRLVFLSAEAFSRDLIQAGEHGALENFRDRIRNADVLAIDGIESLADRQRSQEEFFHAFNALHGAQRQILLTANRAPADLSGVESRLISRFGSGLAVRLDVPCLETRLAILGRKASGHGIVLSDEIAEYIATRAVASISGLLAALTRLDTLSQVRGVPIDLPLAREALEEERTGHSLEMAEILTVVADYFGVRLADLQGQRRHRSVTRPRQISMYLARELTRLSLEEIGAHYGGRDHTTVLHASRRVADERRRDPQLARWIDELTRRLQNGLPKESPA